MKSRSIKKSNDVFISFLNLTDGYNNFWVLNGRPVAYFTKEVNARLAKPPLDFNGGLQ